MSSGSSGSDTGYTAGSQDDGYRTVHGFPAEIHAGQQGKHIPGNNNYQEGRGIIYGGLEKAQQLLDEYAGSGDYMEKSKNERVDFHQIIGEYFGQGDTKGTPTTMGIIHYGNKGAHIVPARPKDYDGEASKKRKDDEDKKKGKGKGKKDKGREKGKDKGKGGDKDDGTGKDKKKGDDDDKQG